MNKSPQSELIDYDLVKWHFYAGILYLLLAIVAGLTFSLQFLQKYPPSVIAE